MNRFFQFAFSKLKGVKVYALVGRSGTGKSYHSKLVAAKHRIDLIIDDGLLIKGNRILAGHSAKKDSDFLAAVRTAVFDDEEHRDEVRDIIKSGTAKANEIGNKNIAEIKEKMHVVI